MEIKVGIPEKNKSLEMLKIDIHAAKHVFYLHLSPNIIICLDSSNISIIGLR